MRECKYMRLSRPELIIACKLMRDKGYMPAVIGRTLRVSAQVVTKILARDDWPVPRSVILDEMLVLPGAEVPHVPAPMSRDEARRITGH